MTVEEFHKEFKKLASKIDEYPANLGEIKRQIGFALTRDKDRRIYEKGKAITHCIMEESDLNKLAQIPTIDAITWKRELKLGRLYGDVKKVRPFICDSCWKSYGVDGIIENKKSAKEEKEMARIERLRQREEYKEAQIVKYIRTGGKEGYATPSQHFYHIQGLMTKELESDLKSMPYKEFLNTRYWAAVRRYVLYRSNFQCSLCASKSSLHVHHKHYKNRGSEIFTWKDDLIVLCANCHAKQHDKLARHAEH